MIKRKRGKQQNTCGLKKSNAMIGLRIVFAVMRERKEIGESSKSAVCEDRWIRERADTASSADKNAIATHLRTTYSGHRVVFRGQKSFDS